MKTDAHLKEYEQKVKHLLLKMRRQRCWAKTYYAEVLRRTQKLVHPLDNQHMSKIKN